MTDLLAGVQLDEGADAAEKMQEEFQPGGDFERTYWLSSILKAKDDVVLLRFLHGHTEWIPMLQHQNVPTKAAPKNASERVKQNWPSSFTAVCRSKNEKIAHLFDGCYICDHMVNPEAKNKRYNPSTRLWALAVERQKVYATAELAAEYGMELADMLAEYGVDEGAFLGIRDVMVTVDEKDDKGEVTGSKIEKPKIIVVNMALKNFFAPLKGFGQAWATKGGILKCDWEITRTGVGKDTTYSIIPEDTITVQRGGKDVVLDMAMPEVDEEGNETGRQLREWYFDQTVPLTEIISGSLDDTRYHRYFDERVEWQDPERDGDGKPDSTGTGQKVGAGRPSGGASVPPPAKASGLNANALKAMRERTKGTAGPAVSPPAAEDSEPTTADA